MNSSRSGRQSGNSFAENDPLIDEALKWFRLRQITKIEEHLVPEAGVKQMQNGVLRSANIKIDAAGLRSAHPITLCFLSDEALVVLWVAKPQVIPT